MKRAVPRTTSVFNAAVLALLAIVVFYVGMAEAQVNTDDMVDRGLRAMRIRFEAFAGYGPNGIQSLLLNTFYLLAVTELSWAMMTVYMRGPDLQAFLSVLVSRVLFISFFAWLLGRGATTANEIFESFVDLAELGIDDPDFETGISPGAIFDLGQYHFARMYQHATDIGVFDIVFDSEISIDTPVLILFVGLAVFITMVILAAHFAVVLLETFVAANAGIILLALGSSRWTYQYAATYLKYAVSVGVKLYVLTIIVGLTINQLEAFHAAADIDRVNNLMSLFVFCLFTTVISSIAPKSVKGMVEGVSVGAASGSVFARANPSRVVSKTTGSVNKLLIPK